METDSRLWAVCAPEHMALLAAGSLQTGWKNKAKRQTEGMFPSHIVALAGFVHRCHMISFILYIYMYIFMDICHVSFVMYHTS